MNQKQPRLHDEGYLKWLRTCVCCVCGVFPPCDAAHIRSASLDHGKPPTGLGEKPSDFWAVPLCRSHHMQQHAHGNELAWWKTKKKNPFEIAIYLYRKYGGRGGNVKRQRTTIKPRLPKSKRQKIPQGKTSWPSRPIASNTRKS